MRVRVIMRCALDLPIRVIPPMDNSILPFDNQWTYVFLCDVGEGGGWREG